MSMIMKMKSEEWRLYYRNDSCDYKKKTKQKKKALYLSVNVFSTKVPIGNTIFYVYNWRRDSHFTWSSEPREGPACCSAKGVPSFNRLFSDPEYWSGPRNRTRDLTLCSQHALPTELTLPRFIMTVTPLYIGYNRLHLNSHLCGKYNA